jgi:hypothetical protein
VVDDSSFVTTEGKERQKAINTTGHSRLGELAMPRCRDLTAINLQCILRQTVWIDPAREI